MGLFQLNGSGMTQYLKELAPTSVHDINVMVALYRPGPMQHIPTFIDAKHGRQSVRFPHPALEEILRRVEAKDLQADDYETIRTVIESYVGLYFAVGDRKQSIFSFQGAAPDKFEAIAAAMDAGSDGAAAVRRTHDLIAEIGIPKRLSDCGVTEDKIAPMTKDAMLSGNILVNPRTTTDADIEALYNAAL